MSGSAAGTTVAHRIDENEQVFHLDLTGHSARALLEQSLVVLETRPELRDWDWIILLPSGPTDITVDDVAAFSERFPREDRDAVTIFVSEDRYLHLWARVMDFQFPGRKHLVVADAEAAARVIAQRRSATKMN
jgi:hypothetical protein